MLRSFWTVASNMRVIRAVIGSDARMVSAVHVMGKARLALRAA